MRGIFQKLMAGESVEIEYFENSIINMDGEARLIAWHNTILTDESGKIIGTLSSGEDITERKKVEENLKESEKKYRHLIEESLLGVAILQARKYVYVNSAFAKLTGYSNEELLGFSPGEVWNLIHIDDRAELESRNIILEEGKPLTPRHKFRYVRKNGEIRWVESLVTVIEYEEKPALQVFENDITDLINAENIQKEFEERRENFITMTTHELRTPLTVISGYLDFLSRRINGMESNQREKIFNVMQNNVYRLERLIAQVSLLSQFEKGIFSLNKKRLNFNNFLREVAEPYTILLENHFRIKGLKKAPELFIEADKDRLIQVLENVLNNAIDHTSPKNRIIELTIEITPVAILLKVKDNGAGIAFENIERIFDQFVSIGTEYSAIGTGVGLYLSKLIIQAHNGKIYARSEGIGHGSVFFIELPRYMISNNG
jgi:PAS domain S-box-containing protein